MTVDLRSDADIVRLVLAGDTQHFQVMVERYERLMYSYLLPQLRSWSDVEDIAQEAFLKAFRHLESFDSSRKFSAWLMKIARNLLIDRFRKNAQQSIERQAYSSYLERFCSPQGDSPPKLVEADEEFRQLFLDMLDLQEDLRVPLLLRVVEELPYEEIAELLDLPLQTVKNRIFKARKALKEKRDEKHAL